MPLKKRAAGGKRAKNAKRAGTDASKLSPVPERETASTSRETRSRSKRTRFAPQSAEAGVDLFNTLSEEMQSEEDYPFGSPPFAANITAPPATRNQQKQREDRAWQATKAKDLSHEETLDWYMDAALKEVKGVLRLVSEGKLRQKDLWNLLTFGQHMYAGIKQFYGIDLNDALLEKEKSNMGKGLALGPANLPWPRPVPKRCASCSRVRTTYLTSEHPWNRTSFGRLYPQEDRYEPGGLFGSEVLEPGIAYDPFNIPKWMGTTRRGWDV